MRAAHRRANAVVILGILFTVVILFGLLFFAGIWSLGGTNYRVSAFVTNARGIAVDSDVVEAGLPVGEVTGISRRGPDAVLTLKITSGPVPLPADSTVQMRLRSLAGEVYVQIFPGKSRVTVPNGGSLGLSQDQGYTEVDEILNDLSGHSEYTTRDLLQGLGAAVKHNGEHLNTLVGSLSSLIIDSAPLTSTLAAQNQHVADVVQYLGTVMNAIGQRGEAVEDFAKGATTTFDAVTDRDTQLRQVLTDLPGTLSSVKAASTAIQDTSPHLTPVLDNLSGAVRELSPAIRYLQPASTSGVQVVNKLGTANPPLRGILTNLDALKPSTDAALPAVHSTLCQLNPMLSYLSPYGGDIANFFEKFGSTANYYEQYGHEFPATLHVNPDNLVSGVTSQPADLLGPLNTLLNAGIFSTLGPDDGYDLNPPPHGVVDKSLGQGLSNSTQWGLTHKYPHITAAC